MANPVLNDDAFKRSEADAGWAAPDAASTTWNPPITDGPTTPYQSVRDDVMTVSGAAWATAALFVLLVAAGVVGWNLVKTDANGDVTSFPGWLVVAALVAFGLAIVSFFKPKMARFTSPLYALAEGVFIGGISHAYDAAYDGIVVQAVGATAAVFGVMLLLYSARIIRVTERFRRIVVGATVGVMIFYGISLLFSLFGHTPAFLYDSSAFGILLSLFVAGLAAFNLALDFDVIERGAKAGAPKYMEWYAALGLMVTLVWLYLELLRLLARLRSR
jgi:uncharacterized YccA/Bax inhibitor family protein